MYSCRSITSRASPFAFKNSCLHTKFFDICRALPYKASPICSQNRYFAIGIVDPIPIDKIRNVAVIAHVDHGKTTLVDALLQKCGTSISNIRLLDLGELEKEKGITILAKSTRVEYKGHTLNIIDTPGHADFGGEVERVLCMVDGIILVIDLIEGPRPQSRFVLSKALRNSAIVPIVVINKVDRQHERREGDIENEVFELFMGLDATDAQMNYNIFYGSAKQGWMEPSWDSMNTSQHPKGMEPLLDSIINNVPCPKIKLDSLRAEGHLIEKAQAEVAISLKDPISPDFSMLVNLVERSDTWGLTVTGRVASGMALKEGIVNLRSAETGVSSKARIREILVTRGIEKQPFPIASTGDIISLQLSTNVQPCVYDTIAASPTAPPLPYTPIDPPVISVEVCPNSSPLQGEDGKLGSLHEIKTRLFREASVNLAISVSENSSKTGVSVGALGQLKYFR